MPSSLTAGGGRTGGDGARPNAAVRLRVAEAYRCAFNGSASALDTLRATADDQDPSDRIHLAGARTHLLYLDGQSQEALSAIETEVFPLVVQFATDLREVFDYNRTIVAMGCEDLPSQIEVDRHHALVDRRASVGFESGSPSKLLDADHAAANGKLYDALPIYTAAFYCAFNSYDWSAWKEAAGRLARAVLKYGDVSQGTFYSFLAEEDVLVEDLARYLVARNDPGAIDTALGVLKRKANLKRHRLMAMKFIAALGEAVPDPAAEEWSESCRSIRRGSIGSLREKAVFDLAWKVSAAVAPALPSAAADQLVDDALSHPLWNNEILRTEALLPAINRAAPHLSAALGARVIDAIARCTKPPLQYGFEDAAFLLAEMYEKRPWQRDLIRNALFPPSEIAPPHLARLAGLLDAETPQGEPEAWVRNAHELLDRQITTTGKQVSVALGGNINAILLITARKKHLREDLLDGIVARMLELIEHPRNVNTNREWMIEGSSFLIDSVGVETGRRAARLYAAYASDHRVIGHPLHGQAEEEHPLNAFRMGGFNGWPQDVRGTALIALGAVASRPELGDGLDLEGLLFAALDDQAPVVRRDACLAVSRTEGAFPDLFRIVLIRAADPDTNVANVALRVLAHRIADVAALSLAGSTLAVARTQARHVEPSVRAAAAELIAVLQALPQRELTPSEQRQLTAVVERLSKDVARSVRRKLKRTER